MERYNLIINGRHAINTQHYYFSQLFEDNIGKPISKRNVETYMCLKFISNQLTFPILTPQDLHAQYKSIQVPGDLQRQLRTFYDIHKRHGLTKQGERDTMVYIWQPNLLSEIATLVPYAARNIFKNDKDISDFISKRQNKCEITSIPDSKERLAIDHWRAHQIYNIDHPSIAVLITETMNNIHHNYDASKIIRKFPNDLSIVKKWVEIECRVRQAGFPPNQEDQKMQTINIQYVNDYHIKLGNTISDEFWQGLNYINE